MEALLSLLKPSEALDSEYDSNFGHICSIVDTYIIGINYNNDTQQFALATDLNLSKTSVKKNDIIHARITITDDPDTDFNGTVGSLGYYYFGFGANNSTVLSLNPFVIMCDIKNSYEQITLPTRISNCFKSCNVEYSNVYGNNNCNYVNYSFIFNKDDTKIIYGTWDIKKSSGEIVVYDIDIHSIYSPREILYRVICRSLNSHKAKFAELKLKLKK